MRHAAAGTALLAALLAVAGACSFLAYRALSPRAEGVTPWARAAAVARKADRTKAVLPALQTRQQAVALFDDLARTGPSPARSRARLAAAILQVENAGAQSDPTQSLALAVGELRKAVRIDRANDDAAHDLEVLLARSVQSGHPIGDAKPEKKRARGKAGASAVGTGY